jgi:hypothetical protein
MSRCNAALDRRVAMAPGGGPAELGDRSFVDEWDHSGRKTQEFCILFIVSFERGQLISDWQRLCELRTAKKGLVDGLILATVYT